MRTSFELVDAEESKVLNDSKEKEKLTPKVLPLLCLFHLR